MLCKVTSKNQLTLPKEIIQQFMIHDYFDARVEDGHIVLEPVIVRPLAGEKLRNIRAKVKASGLTEEDAMVLVDEAKHAPGS